MRLTRANKSILNILGKEKCAVDAATLIDSKVADRATIYRQLNKLVAQGKIAELNLGDGKKRYEIWGAKHHHHLVCDRCGKVEHIMIKEDKLVAGIKSGFKITRHAIEFFGLCKMCQGVND